MGATAAPKVILISLDGETPWLLNQHLASGVLSRGKGAGLLQSRGIRARRYITVSPSLTAPGHIAIAGHASFSPALQKTSPLDTFTLGGVTYPTWLPHWTSPMINGRFKGASST